MAAAPPKNGALTLGTPALKRPKNKPAPLSDLESARWAIRVAAGEPLTNIIAPQLPPEWVECCTLAEEDGEKGIGDFLANMQARGNVDRLEAIATALKTVREEVPGEAVAEERKPSFGIIGSEAFAKARYVREWLVQDILVKGQPAIVGGPRKGLKTSQILDFTVSLGSGTPFLGTFAVPKPTRVLFLSGESGDATIQETANRVCRAKGIDLEDLEGFVFWGFELPRLSDAEHMGALAATIAENGIECVIIDPLYLCLLSGGGSIDASNLFQMGPLLQQISRTCLNAGATPILVHHLRKNREDPHSPPELDDLAYAGIQEFARQWIMIGRRETYEPGTGEHKLWLSVGGSVGHNMAWAVDISEGVLADDFTGRQWNVAVTPATAARKSFKEQDKAAKDERRREKEEDEAKQVRDRAIDAHSQLEKLGFTSKSAWRESLGWNSLKFGPPLTWLIENRWIEAVEVEVKTGSSTRAVAGFRALKPDANLNPDEPGRNPDATRTTLGCPGSDLNPDNPDATRTPPPLLRRGESGVVRVNR